MARLSELWGLSEATLQTLVSSRYGSGSLARSRRAGTANARRADRGAGTGGLTVERGVRIGRPASEVWPWLCQLMRGGGMYGWTALESPSCRSAEHLITGLPPPRIGDRINDCLRIDAVEPGRMIRWASPGDLHLMNHRLGHASLEYAVEPAGESACDLTIIVRARCPGLTSQVAWYLVDVLDFLLPCQQVARLKRLIEARPVCEDSAAPPRSNGAVHQVAAFIPEPTGAPDQPAGPSA